MNTAAQIAEPWTPEQLQSAVAMRKHLWSACMSWSEDARITALEIYCRGMMKNRAAGDRLTNTALWS